MQFIRNFCFTLNNYTEEEEADLAETINNVADYLIFGRERGVNGTAHLQGYMELKKNTRFTTLKKMWPRMHIESRRGTQQQAIAYCMKEGDYNTFGAPKQQGYRTDLDRTRQVALTGGMREITTIGNLQAIKVAEKFLTYNEEPRDWQPEVKWFWGSTGTGKSRQARIELGEDVYTKNDGSKWWDGYDGHEDVIIDDFRPSWWSLTEMLSLLDRYEKRIEFKGGWRQFRPRRIIITSAFAPEECYKSTGECIAQLTRRINETRHLVADVPEVAEVILDNSATPLDI